MVKKNPNLVGALAWGVFGGVMASIGTVGIYQALTGMSCVSRFAPHRPVPCNPGWYTIILAFGIVLIIVGALIYLRGRRQQVPKGWNHLVEKRKLDEQRSTALRRFLEDIVKLENFQTKRLLSGFANP